MDSLKQIEIFPLFEDQKKKHPSAILIFRVGDHYEAYGEDAKYIANISDIALGNGKYEHPNGTTITISFVEFHRHALDIILPRLIRKGQRVAIYDQLELTQRTVRKERN